MDVVLDSEEEMLEDVDTDKERNLDFEQFKKIMSQTMGATDTNKEMREQARIQTIATFALANLEKFCQ